MSIIHPSDFELFDETLTVAKRLPGLREITHRIVLPGDQELSVRSYFYSLGASVEATRLVGVMFDISQLSEAMHSLRAMDQRSKLALSESQDGLFDWDLVTNKVTYNARAADLMGLKNGHSESEFSSLLDLVHPGDRDSGLKAVQDHLDGLAPFFEYELRIRFSDGKYHWVHLRGKALRDTEGKPARLLGLSTDIDNRKHAELALRESEEWLRGAVEGSFDAIKILRSVRNELGVVVADRCRDSAKDGEENQGDAPSKVRHAWRLSLYERNAQSCDQERRCPCTFPKHDPAECAKGGPDQARVTRHQCDHDDDRESEHQNPSDIEMAMGTQWLAPHLSRSGLSGTDFHP